MTVGNRKLGPNMQRFLAVCVAGITVRAGRITGNHLATAIETLSSAERIKGVTLEGLKLADQAIEAMRSASDKIYSDDEEEIAAILLAELDKRENRG